MGSVKVPDMLHRALPSITDINNNRNESYNISLGKDSFMGAQSVAHLSMPMGMAGGRLVEPIKRLQKQAMAPPVRNVVPRLRAGSEELQELNPEPLPYQTQYFKSSTLVKMVPMPRRHADISVEKPSVQTSSPRKKAIIIHSERYQWDELRPEIDPLRSASAGNLSQRARMSQQERMLAEKEYIAKLRSQKRKRDNPPHREPRELLMGGTKAPFGERFDIKDELRRLRSIVLPVNARELYHGRGINLPPSHASIKPRLSRVQPLPQATPILARSHTVPAEVPLGRKHDIDSFMSSLHQDALNALKRSGDEASAAGMGERGEITSRPISVGEEADENFSVHKDVTSLSTESAHGLTSTRALKTQTPNPLRGANTNLFNIDSDELRKLFVRLDTDADGHLTYPQVMSHSSNGLSLMQEKFVKQIYEITSSSTFFGVQEFIQLQCLCEEIAKLSTEVVESYVAASSSTLKDDVMQYVELFELFDKEARGYVSISSLEDILSTVKNIPKDANFAYAFQHVTLALELDQETYGINKVKFVAAIPYFSQMEKLFPADDFET